MIAFLRIKFLSVLFLMCAVTLVHASENDQPFAVLELFTSEGCSSCPSADKLLSKMVDQSLQSNSRIFPIEFHVDYWDYLGWKDPYSSKIFSQRQRRYAQSLKSSSVYTPQMIVNGRIGFGGYRQDRLRTNLKEALQKPAHMGVGVALVSLDAQSVTVQCDVSDINRNANLLIALVERDLNTDVPKGENAGRNLHHDNVVRAFKTILLDDFQHEATLRLPQDLKVEKASVIAYVQDRQSMHILGANKIDLTSLK